MKRLYDKYEVIGEYRISHKLYLLWKLFSFKRTKRAYYIQYKIIFLGISYTYEKCYWNWNDWPLYND